jgi:hypothetical protein
MPDECVPFKKMRYLQPEISVAENKSRNLSHRLDIITAAIPPARSRVQVRIIDPSRRSQL